MKTPVEILELFRTYITQGYAPASTFTALTKEGKSTHWNRDDAHSFTMSGAFHKAKDAPYRRGIFDNGDIVEELMWVTRPANYDNCGGWGNWEYRTRPTQADVLAWIDRALELARKKEAEDATED